VLLVVLWRLRYKLSLRDLAAMFLERGFVFSHVNAGVAIVAEKVSDYDPEKLRWDIDLTRALTTEYPRA